MVFYQDLSVSTASCLELVLTITGFDERWRLLIVVESVHVRLAHGVARLVDLVARELLVAARALRAYFGTLRKPFGIHLKILNSNTCVLPVLGAVGKRLRRFKPMALVVCPLTEGDELAKLGCHMGSTLAEFFERVPSRMKKAPANAEEIFKAVAEAVEETYQAETLAFLNQRLSKANRRGCAAKSFFLGVRP